jgi:nitrogen regulatory protein P-II 1
MKRIEAIIRPARTAEVCSALEEIDCHDITLSSVEEQSSKQQWTHHVRTGSYQDRSRAGVKIEAVVADKDADRAIRAIRGDAAHDSLGDGTIFVQELTGTI